MAIEMQQQDEETGLNKRLCGRNRHQAMGWDAAGHRVAECLGDASSCRASQATHTTLASAAENAAINGNFFPVAPMDQVASQVKGKAGFPPEPV